MTDKTQYISAEKKVSLEEELHMLKTEKTPAIAKRIDEARQMGDLSENAEYHQAREDMAWAQGRLKEIEHILQHAEVITSSGSSTVEVGSTIEVDLNGKQRTFEIVGPQEADPLAGRISNESPLGQAFLGKTKGDSVDVEVPAGTQTYKILDVK